VWHSKRQRGAFLLVSGIFTLRDFPFWGSTLNPSRTQSYIHERFNQLSLDRNLRLIVSEVAYATVPPAQARHALPSTSNTRIRRTTILRKHCDSPPRSRRCLPAPPHSLRPFTHIFSITAFVNTTLRYDAARASARLHGLGNGCPVYR